MFESSKWMYSSGAAEFYDHPIEQSLRFNDDDSAYLSWTPASTGNRKTWTWSGWVKRGNLGSDAVMFGQYTATTDTGYLRFSSSTNIIRLVEVQSGSTTFRLETTPVYRDTSAWYHIVISVDTTQATSSDRIKLYVNGEQVTDFSSTTYPSLNLDTDFNSTAPMFMGQRGGNSQYFDGYLAEVHFIDGQALDASYFGETVSGVWKPIEYTGTYGDNGFYLPFNHDYSVEGFSAVTYRGTGSDQYIGGVGFQPDLVWAKNRSSAIGHVINDSVRGAGYNLTTNSTDAESSGSNRLTSFDTDGFSLGDAGAWNTSGDQYVAWCWDAGSGSPVSNTDGSITSTVKANPTYGFSIVSYTGTGANATIGHGLSSAPEMVILKARTGATKPWKIGHTSLTDWSYRLHFDTGAQTLEADVWNSTAPTSSVFSIGTDSSVNVSSVNYIAYCFHSVSGYSKIGSYTGTGASGNSVTTGFKPAFVMIKRTDVGDSWAMYDNVRDLTGDIDDMLYAERSDAEAQNIYAAINFTDTGFSVDSIGSTVNNSGGTYIYMAFADKREAAFWLDQSGNNNDFENNNLTESDISLDSPTNNFATFSPLLNRPTYTDLTYYEGNLEVYSSSRSDVAFTGFAPTSGKWYVEALKVDGTRVTMMGLVNINNVTGNNADRYLGTGNTTYDQLANYRGSGEVRVNNLTAVSTGLATISAGDILGIAFDCDAGSVSFYVNGTLQYTHSSGLSWLAEGACLYIQPDDDYAMANFGQDSSFAGNKVAQGNTDDNGYGDFYYAPPTGYLALCTANLEVPDAMNPALDASPQDYFNTVLYTGNGSTQSITGVGFQPDFFWTKGRNIAEHHCVFDSVRGNTVNLKPNLTNADAAQGKLDSFDSDGFTLSTASNEINGNGYNYVAWNWKANGSGVSNTDGSITSTVSANTDAGFSIVTWTTPATGTATVGHGLSEAPELIITKATSISSGWNVYHSSNTSAPETDYLRLDLTNATADSNTIWNDTAPTSSVFTQGTWYNGSFDAIAYCFHSVEGFSKFGSYTGNGSTDGSFIYCGFRPSLIVVKNTTSATGWEMYDDERIGFNEQNNVLRANDSAAELSYSGRAIDLVSNGFKVRSSDTPINASGNDYIYMAFAENPFKYANAR